MRHLQPPCDRLGIEQRTADRLSTVVPIEVDGCPGWTRDVSATGVYLESDEARAIGSIVNLTLEIVISGQKLTLLCEGKVVRIDRGSGGKIGLAAQLRTSFLSEGHDAGTSGFHAVPLALDD